MRDPSSRHLLIITIVSGTLLLILSGVPWSSLTGGRVKDFSFFSDLYASAPAQTLSGENENIDPELLAFQEEVSADTTSVNMSAAVLSTATVEPAVEAPTLDGHVLIENYSSGECLPNLKAAIADPSRLARIAFLGDSFIEGDILTQNLRAMLQEEYGGAGVGFMAMHSEFPGFRQSVRQSDQGWTITEVRNQPRSDSLRLPAGVYAAASAVATATFRGVQRAPFPRAWQRSRFLFMAPDTVAISITTDSGSNIYRFEPSGQVQCLEVDEPTSQFSVEINEGSLIGLGAYLDAPTGVALDCMSMRGNSGLTLRYLNPDLCAQTSRWADYDLIIVEFGINALSADQTDYRAYGAGMRQAIQRLRQCFPNADILLMGIADRGMKNGSEVHSMPTCAAMTNQQRQIAAREGCAFYDTRQAQGGDGAIVRWREQQLVNSDYIHLNHDGGQRLASELFFALTTALSQ